MDNELCTYDEIIYNRRNAKGFVLVFGACKMKDCGIVKTLDAAIDWCMTNEEMDPENKGLYGYIKLY